VEGLLFGDVTDNCEEAVAVPGLAIVEGLPLFEVVIDQGFHGEVVFSEPPQGFSGWCSSIGAIGIDVGDTSA
jgi:hypothetical protein